MQQEYLAKPRLLAISEIDRALDNCRKVLDHSRSVGLPVAFMRLVNESAFFNRATPFVRWIEGFEPYRNEMVFERSSPSCYSCEPFTALVNQSRGGIVLAGFAGEAACLSTLIDAFHRNHKVTYLCDASASHALDDVSADEIHRAVSKISEQCRAVLAETTNRETVQLLSVAILQLRMKLNQVADSELKALCDAMVPDDGTAEGSEDPKSQDQRRRALLKLVK